MPTDTMRSYTSASSLPAKVIRHERLRVTAAHEFIPPLHIQLMPTNRCNLKCSFCSCAGRDKAAEMPLVRVVRCLDIFKGLGTEAVTITGGGEPLLHPDIEVIFEAAQERGMDVGLVTNGLLLEWVSPAALRRLSWCRISASDDRDVIPKARRAVEANAIDWAFSYVLTRNPDWRNLAAHVAFANEHNFTHVRLVSDLVDIDATAWKMGHAAEALARAGVDASRVIFQPRQDSERGAGRCLISLLKPVIDPAGVIFPCCGAQYALDADGRAMPAAMGMGQIEDAPALWAAQAPFNGAVCRRCYYGDYNRALAALSGPIHHERFAWVFLVLSKFNA